PSRFVDGQPDEPGSPLRTGNALAGRELFRGEGFGGFGGGEFTCASCHNLPTGLSAAVQDVPVGPNEESHLGLIRLGRSDLLPFKGPQLRNLADKLGMSLSA